VDTNLEPLRRLLKQTFPNETVTVQSSRDSISMIGQVSSAAAAERIVAMAAPFGKTIVNNLIVALPPADKQIMLKVKFAELDRTKSLQYGVNLTSTGATNTLGSISTGQFSATKPTTLGGAGNSSFTISDALNIFAFRPDLNLSAFIKALQGEAILQILAEPNLVTTSGKEASFLVGGEFPVPILQGGANSGSVTVSFREFGIRLRFLPVLTDNKTVKMHLMHEVTTIDLANAVQVAGFTIPALSSRRAETDIELGIGQSFVVAGLIDNRETENIAKIPGLANLPILGQLFKSKDMKTQRTELVLIVTPEITQALAPGEKAPTPYLPKDFLVPITPPPTKQASAAPAATTESAEKTSSSRHRYGLRRSTN
jgi:pilus assembly protein CpaC